MGRLNQNRNELPFEQQLQEVMAYQKMRPQDIEQKYIEQVFARLFSSEDGKRALAYLQMIGFQRALGPQSSDQELRYLEGQRAMVAAILRLIDRGRQG